MAARVLRVSHDRLHHEWNPDVRAAQGKCRSEELRLGDTNHGERTAIDCQMTSNGRFRSRQLTAPVCIADDGDRMSPDRDVVTPRKQAPSLWPLAEEFKVLAGYELHRAALGLARAASFRLELHAGDPRDRSDLRSTREFLLSTLDCRPRKPAHGFVPARAERLEDTIGFMDGQRPKDDSI